jgi:pimeloyl-ACP methyl ester carboxylesterase
MPQIDVVGVQTYYEEYGQGDPVVLLHGGLESGADWSPLGRVLAHRYRVLAPDRRGHGRTPDVDGPYTYDAVAAETAAFVEHQVGGPASLVGYSDGGNAALLVARDRPELVRRVVTIGSNFNADGLVPQFIARLQNPDPDSPRIVPIRDTYAATSPDGPEHWSTFYLKVAEMGRTGPAMTLDDLRRIACPVLVVVADDDVVILDHALAMYDALRLGQLAVVPGTSHLVHHERPELLATLVDAFLTDPTPHRLMPMRSASDR